MDNVVIITGASSGIGRRVAEILSPSSKCVLISRRDPYIPNTMHIKCDLSRIDEIEKLSESLNKDVDSVKLLVHCAGVMRSCSSASLNGEIAIESYMVNAIAPLILTSKLTKKIAKVKGVAIAVSSVASQLDLPGEAFYSSSKAALDKGFEILGADLSRLGGTYLKIHPCMIDTPMTEGLSSHQRDFMLTKQSTQKQPTVEEIAIFIASLKDASPWLTGSSLLFGGLKR